MPTGEMPERLSIWIDIEGFSFLHENFNPQAMLILGRLVEDLYLIGSRVYPESPDRLFIHQFGDGFVVVTDFMEESLDRIVSVAVALMKSVLSYGGLARAGISSGDFADITGCLPDSLRNILENRALPVGRGRMTITSVMGGALINAHRAAADGLSGPSLRIDSKFRERILAIEGLVINDETDKTISLNWLKSEMPQVNQILETIRGNGFSPDLLSRKLREYIGRFDDKLTDDWKSTADRLLGA